MVSIKIDQAVRETENLERVGKELRFLEDELVSARRSLSSLSGMGDASGRLGKIIEKNRRNSALCSQFRAVLENTARTTSEFENRIIDYGEEMGRRPVIDNVTETDLSELWKRVIRL